MTADPGAPRVTPSGADAEMFGYVFLRDDRVADYMREHSDEGAAAVERDA